MNMPPPKKEEDNNEDSDSESNLIGNKSEVSDQTDINYDLITDLPVGVDMEDSVLSRFKRVVEDIMREQIGSNGHYRNDLLRMTDDNYDNMVR